MIWDAAAEQRQPWSMRMATVAGRSAGVGGGCVGGGCCVGRLLLRAAGRSAGGVQAHGTRYAMMGFANTGQRTAAAAVAGVDWCSIERWELGKSFA